MSKRLTAPYISGCLTVVLPTMIFLFVLIGLPLLLSGFVGLEYP
jgi:hypothetical protein